MTILLSERFPSKMHDVADAIPIEIISVTGDQPLLFEGLASVPPSRCRVLCRSKSRHHGDRLFIVVSSTSFASIRPFSVVCPTPLLPKQCGRVGREILHVTDQAISRRASDVNSRVCYDEKFKVIRFRKYRNCLDRLGRNDVIVLEKLVGAPAGTGVQATSSKAATQFLSKVSGFITFSQTGLHCVRKFQFGSTHCGFQQSWP